MNLLKKDQLKTVGVVALMIAGYVLFVYLPSGRHQEALAEQVQQDQQRLDEMREIDLGALRDEVAAEQAKLKAEQRPLPTQREVYVVLDGVSGSLLDEQSVEHQLTQSDPRHFANYGVQPIDLDFEGGFTEAFTALSAIEQMPYPVRIERLELVGDADDADGRIHAAVRLSAFFEEGSGHE